jgi:hypothetical protein
MNSNEGGKIFDYKWMYCSVIGKMNYLEKSTQGALAFSMHQCARYMSKPMRSHGEAVKRIRRYLLGTRNKDSSCTLIKENHSNATWTLITAATGIQYTQRIQTQLRVELVCDYVSWMSHAVGIPIAVCVCTEYY